MNIMGMGVKKSDAFNTERSFASKNDLPGGGKDNNYDFR